MPATAIKVQDVSKVFRIYDRPGDRLKELVFLGRRKLHTDFQALRRISFEVARGEFLGIVGRNGAGKSTLLRILSRELTPTDGTVTIEGKVSLLQLGVGFDPEMTGVDNARFASKLLGYDDDQIERMLADIAAFAEIGEFISHPVKTYSSGMYSRLSFAVGINIDPDILIADEVLSVGDMRFAQKCLRKLHEFKERGKTVVFVSHDIYSLNAFCDTAMWIKEGQIYMRGACKDVTMCFQNYMVYDKLPDQYARESLEKTGDQPASLFPVREAVSASGSFGDVEWTDLAALPALGDGRAEIRRMAFVRADTLKSPASWRGNEEVALLLDIHVRARMEAPQIGFVVYDQRGLPALHTNNDICGGRIEVLPKGQRACAKFTFRLPAIANGRYILSLGVQTGLQMAHKIDGAYEFSVARADNKAAQCGHSIIEEEEFNLIDLSTSEPYE